MTRCCLERKTLAVVREVTLTLSEALEVGILQGLTFQLVVVDFKWALMTLELASNTFREVRDSSQEWSMVLFENEVRVTELYEERAVGFGAWNMTCK